MYKTEPGRVRSKIEIELMPSDGLSHATMKSVKVSVPTPDTFTLALPGFAKHGPGLHNPYGVPLRTVDVSPVSVTVTKAFVNGVVSSVPVPVTLSVYVIGVARTGLTQPSRATVATTVSTSR